MAVGNGSSGIQLVPGVAARPGVTLTHFIRSGGYFLPKGTHPIFFCPLPTQLIRLCLVNSDFTPLAKWAFAHLPGAQRLYRNWLFFSAYVSPVQWPPLLRDVSDALSPGRKACFSIPLRCCAPEPAGLAGPSAQAPQGHGAARVS